MTGFDAAVAGSRVRRAALVLSLIALGAGLLSLLFGPLTRERVLRYFHAGHWELVTGLIEQGKELEALDALDGASLIDQDDLRMLDRMARLNQESDLLAPVAGNTPFEARARDAELRFRIGSAVYSKLSKHDALSAADLALLDRAIANSQILIDFEPDSARAHFLFGILHLLRWRASGDTSERWQAMAQLEKALVLEPMHGGARRALEQARLAP